MFNHNLIPAFILQSPEEQLLDACIEGNVAKVRELVDAGEVDVNYEDCNGDIPLYIACHHGYLNVVKALLRHPKIKVDKRCNGSTAFYVACEKGYEKIVKLLQPFVDVHCTVDDHSPLFIACKNGHAKVVKNLLLHENLQVNMKSKGFTPFFIACQYGHLEIVQLLMADRRLMIARDYSKKTPFQAACYKEHLGVINFLMNHPHAKDMVENTGGQALYDACVAGNTGVAMSLLACPLVNVNYEEKCSTPFMLACASGQIEIVKALLAHPNTDIWKEQDGKTGLQLCLEQIAILQKEEESCIKQRLPAYNEIAYEIILHAKWNEKAWKTNAYMQPEVQDRLSAALFALAVLVCDDYYKLPSSSSKLANMAERFFSIASRLPIELQMVLCNKVPRSEKIHILSQMFEVAAKTMINRPPASLTEAVIAPVEAHHNAR